MAKIDKVEYFFTVQNREEQIKEWIEAIIAETEDCFLVSAKMSADANYKFFIDSDTGFSLEKSVKINRALRNQIDESGLFPEGMYSLEISSPGLSEPLAMPRQYKKNIGRLLEIETETETFEGRIKEVNDDEIHLEIKNKNSKGIPTDKLPKKMITMNINNIKKATVQVEFN